MTTTDTPIPSSPISSCLCLDEPLATSSTIYYTVELLPNIQLVDLTVFGANNPTAFSFNGSITLNAIDYTATLAVSDSNQQQRIIVVPLPKGVVDISRRTQQQTDDHVHIKIPWQGPISLDATTASLMPASIYRDIISVHCIECNQCVVTTNGQGFERVLDMPSDYWREMVDFWICHREEYKIVPKAEELLKTRSDQLLVSASRLFVHPSQLCLDKLKVVKDTNNANTHWWSLLECCACKSPLGHVRLDNDDIIEAKLDKWALSTQNKMANENNRIPPISFIRYFAVDLVELGRAHAGYRILVQEQTTKQTRLMIWVLNWSTQLLTNTLQLAMADSESTNHLPKYWEVIKLLYCKISLNTASNVTSKSLLTNWETNKQVETMTLHTKWCDALTEALDASSRALPPSRRVGFPGFTVGFLPLHPVSIK
ncbi:HECT-like ubiquitin-conjugating enzyme-binding-domain-containing protein [Syncephalis fuscata]|nr:HECT-like ubiquitin-conjugating enzyme-binding-domain-containing protein [Syncephalis fuscata]